MVNTIEVDMDHKQFLDQDTLTITTTDGGTVETMNSNIQRRFQHQNGQQLCQLT